MSMAEHNLLVVDTEDDFVAAAKELFEGRLPVARSIEEASQTIESGELRMLLLGPSYSSAESMDQIRTLHNQDPALVLMMVADEVTADLLRYAMRAGVSDVIEAPLDETKIEAAIEELQERGVEHLRFQHVVWFKDPAGNTVEIQQDPALVP